MPEITLEHMATAAETAKTYFETQEAANDRTVSLKRIVTGACNATQDHALMYVTEREMAFVLCFLSEQATGTKTTDDAGTPGIQCGPAVTVRKTDGVDSGPYDVTTAGQLDIAYTSGTGDARSIFMAVGDDEVGEDEEPNVYVIDIDNYHGSAGKDEGTIVITDKDTPLPRTILKWTVLVQQNVIASAKFIAYYTGRHVAEAEPRYRGRSRIRIWKIVHRNWKRRPLSRGDAQTQIDDMVQTAEGQMTHEEVMQSPQHQDLAIAIQERVAYTQDQADARIRLDIIKHVELKNLRDTTGYSDPQMLDIINHLSKLVFKNRPIRTTAFPGGPVGLEPLFFVNPFQWRKDSFQGEEQGMLFHQLITQGVYERRVEDCFLVD
jgi:hypothetical protein